MSDPIEALRAVYATDESLWFSLRSEMVWDERAFQAIVRAAPPAWEALHGRAEVPRWLLSFLTFQLQGCLGMMGHHLLVVPGADGWTPKTRKAWLNRRREFLTDCVRAFAEDVPLRPEALQAVAVTPSRG